MKVKSFINRLQISKILGFGFAVLLCGVFYQMNPATQRSLECVTFVDTGTDSKEKSKNNCTEPELSI